MELKRVYPDPPPPPLTRAEDIAQAAAICACLFFAAVSFWEILGPLQGGHYASAAGYAIAGENMAKWHKFAVEVGYDFAAPTPDKYYCHHPYGVAVLDAIAYAVFGHHWYTIRLPAIFCSVLTPPLIYRFGRVAWGVVPAAVATIAFVFVPIDLAFCNFGNLEVPTIFFGALFSWATARLWQAWKPRYVTLASIGALGACQADWVGIVLVGCVVGFAFLRAYVMPRRWYGRLEERAHARWFGYATAAAMGTFAMYVVLFAKADKLGDFISGYHTRSAGSEDTWAAIFTQRRKMWFNWMVTPLGLGTVVAGLPFSAFRLTRRPVEIIPIAWTFAATFQYLVFKQGADVHIFWPHYFGPAAALAAGVVTASFMGIRRRLLARLSDRVRPFVSDASKAMIAVLLVAPLALLARMSLPQLVQSRITGGRFDDGGRYIATDADVAQFTAWAVSDVPLENTGVLVQNGFDHTYNTMYGAHRPSDKHGGNVSGASTTDPDRILILDARVMSPGELSAIATHFSTEAVGPYWRVDRSHAGSSVVAMRYRETQPNLLEWLFVSGTDLVRRIGPEDDQFASWEWNNALGIDTVSPSAAPGTFDELRVAHNVALARNDTGRAGDLWKRVMGKVKNPERIDFTGDLHILAIDVDRGAATVVTLLWEAGASYKPVDTYFQVKCNVTAPPKLWKGPTDYFEKDMAPVPPIHPSMYKPGFLYVQRFVALHRIGTEECKGSFPTAELHPVAGPRDPVIFTLD